MSRFDVVPSTPPPRDDFPKEEPIGVPAPGEWKPEDDPTAPRPRRDDIEDIPITN